MELKLGDSEYELKLFERFKELVQAGGMQLQCGESTSKPGIYNLLTQSTRIQCSPQTKVKACRVGVVRAEFVAISKF